MRVVGSAALLTLLAGLSGVAAQMRLELSTGDEPASAGMPISLSLTATNEVESPLTLDFPDGQRYDFEVIADEGGTVWRWSEGRFFDQMLGRETLDAGAALTWTGRLEAGLPPGAYRIVATLTTVEPRTVAAEITVISGGDEGRRRKG